MAYIEGMKSRITLALVEARCAAQMSQGELAAAVGLSRPFVCDIEAGRRELPRQRYGQLPARIRRAVIDAAIAELEALR